MMGGGGACAVPVTLAHEYIDKGRVDDGGACAVLVPDFFLL